MKLSQLHKHPILAGSYRLPVHETNTASLPCHVEADFHIKDAPN